MGMKTAEVKPWGPVKWQTQVKRAVPSGDGAIGVLFVWARDPKLDWTDNPMYGGDDIDDPRSADFVIKPADGSVATTKLAEHVMARTMGAISLHTFAIARTDPRFAHVLRALQNSKDRVAQAASAVQHRGRSVQRAIQELHDRWQQIWPHYQSAKALMVQEMAENMHELAKVYRDYSHQGLERALANSPFMRNLGKLFVVDAVLGNGDRLARVNTGNILFHQTTQQIFTVDSQAILTNFHRAQAEYGSSLQDWVESIVKLTSQSYPITGDPTAHAPVSFGMRDLYDPLHWWRNEFRPHLEETLRKDKVASPGDNVWGFGYTNFRVGVDQGLAAVDNQLSGINWMLLKQHFKGLEKKYGSSANLDWTNFKIRRMYVRMVIEERGRAGTAEDKQARAMQRVLAYAERKYPQPHV